ncbi:MAG: hypothetical protein EAX87_09795 [Candidatus Thorarchaeota archaeon]|nr:hypothetical protein [Candidatus Thorarchaeota archaeon]
MSLSPSERFQSITSSLFQETILPVSPLLVTGRTKLYSVAFTKEIIILFRLSIVSRDCCSLKPANNTTKNCIVLSSWILKHRILESSLIDWYYATQLNI